MFSQLGDLFVHLFTGIHYVLDSIGPTVAGIDYMSFAMIGTAVLLIPSAWACLVMGSGCERSIIALRSAGRLC